MESLVGSCVSAVEHFKNPAHPVTNKAYKSCMKTGSNVRRAEKLTSTRAAARAMALAHALSLTDIVAQLAFVPEDGSSIDACGVLTVSLVSCEKARPHMGRQRNSQIGPM